MPMSSLTTGTQAMLWAGSFLKVHEVIFMPDLRESVDSAGKSCRSPGLEGGREEA